MQIDAIVLGAGIIGVSTAIHLANRGRSVVLVDRRQPGEETSYGNAGLIQREGVLPHPFPQNLPKLMRYGLNQQIDMHYDPAALPALAPFLAQYWWNSRPGHYKRIVKQYEALIANSVHEHAALIASAGADALIGKHGWYKVFRTAAARDKDYADAEWIEREFGVGHEQLTPAQMHEAEPELRVPTVGALHWTDPWTIKDPHALTMAYVALFERLGGTFRIADASKLEVGSDGMWRLATPEGTVEARDVVVALGPWADLVTAPLGYKLPLAVKRGYHMHYRPLEGKPLRNWVIDAEPGYFLAPMNQGIRLTTGAEFAFRDAKPTPVQVDRAEKVAREIFPLGERIDREAWMGARPCTPDMMPIIGPAPRHKGLWFAFGHAHHGMTLGPVTGRLIAELITGADPFVNVAPFSATRFG